MWRRKKSSDRRTKDRQKDGARQHYCYRMIRTIWKENGFLGLGMHIIVECENACRSIDAMQRPP